LRDHSDHHGRNGRRYDAAMRLWQLYIATVLLAVGSVAAMFWLGALVQEARASGAKREACAMLSASPDDPRCRHK
jgi:hypothetical protein